MYRRLSVAIVITSVLSASAFAQDACKNRGDLDPLYCDDTAIWSPIR